MKTNLGSKWIYWVANLGLGISLVNFGACSKSDRTPERSPFASQPAVAAPESIAASFLVKQEGETQTPQSSDGGNSQSNLAAKSEKNSLSIKSNSIGIQASSLDKEFLLQASIIHQQFLPMFMGAKSRVVAFKKYGNKLYLMEASQGHQLTPELPLSLVLAEFPITEESDEIIYFDFNAGMNKLFLARDWHVSDFEGGMYVPVLESLSAEVSYVESAETVNNQLVITQVAQLVSRQQTNSHLPVRVKYYLTPYQPNPNFTATVPKGFDRVGFFEVNPQLNQFGWDALFASKFDHTKPISFTISKSTPVEYRDAVAEGILYWNKAFGKEVLKVAVAEDDIVAPAAHANIVQWVNCDFCGFAYADAQMDPRSGEILHAQVFMTSTFAFFGKYDAKQLLQNLRNKRLEGDGSRERLITLRGLSAAPLCRYELSTSFIESLADLLAQDVSDEVILKASQDYVRETVAHEIGHTLGLRHNFAGSLAANFPLSERDTVVRSYLTTGAAPLNTQTTSSVMEYQLFEESIVDGDLLRKNSNALPYDHKAIQMLYNKANFPYQDIPLFCTDSHRMTGSYLDCAAGDAGSSPIGWMSYRNKKKIERVARLFAESYVLAKAPPQGLDTQSVEEVVFNPASANSKVKACSSNFPGKAI